MDKAEVVSTIIVRPISRERERVRVRDERPASCSELPPLRVTANGEHIDLLLSSMAASQDHYRWLLVV